MAIEVFNRVEKKYLITEEVYDKFYNKIAEYMEADAYCKNGQFYAIHNIYYDTENDDLIRTSIDKPVYKEKLRLRSYGIAELDSKVFLEIKKKYKGVVNKRRTKLTLRQAYDFTERDVLPTEGDFINRQVVNEIDYFIKFYRPIPKLFLAYDRVAMFGKEDNNLRITFDRNIRTRREDLRLDTSGEGEQLLEPGHVLMEIKTPTSFPLWLTNILTELNIKPTSFSKYGTEYKQYVLNEK